MVNLFLMKIVITFAFVIRFVNSKGIKNAEVSKYYNHNYIINTISIVWKQHLEHSTRF